MASQRKQPYISPEEYFELQRTSDQRSEYIAGEIFEMAAPSKRHGQITAAVSRQLGNHLDGKPCEASIGISVAAPASYLIPDLVVYCEGGEFTGDNDILKNPVVIFEVLSTSTSDFDHGHKWIRYQQIPSLMHYVLISQDEPRIEVFTRENDGWRYQSITGLENKIVLPHIGCILQLASLYERVVFDNTTIDL